MSANGVKRLWIVLFALAGVVVTAGAVLGERVYNMHGRVAAVETMAGDIKEIKADVRELRTLWMERVP